MKKSILAAGALSLAVSFAFGTMAYAGSAETAQPDPVVAQQPTIGDGLSPAAVAAALLLAAALTGKTTSSTTSTTN